MTIQIRDVTERKTLIGNILTQLKPHSVTGKLDWDGYFKTHTDESIALGYADRATDKKTWNANNVLARFMLNKSKKAKADRAAAQTPLIPYKVDTARFNSAAEVRDALAPRRRGPGRGKRISWNDDDYELAVRIIEEYPDPTRKKATNWARAFIEHPDWKAQLGRTSHKALMAFFARVKHKVKYGMMGRKATPAIHTNGLQQPVVTMGQEGDREEIKALRAMLRERDATIAQLEMDLADAKDISFELLQRLKRAPKPTT